MRRGTIVRAPRANVVRLARWLKLTFESCWSRRHLASLVYWRITRDEARNRH